MNGTAKIDISIQDLSVVRNTGVKGVIAVCGPTERGPINSPVLIGSWQQFRKTFGGLLTTSDFPLYCRRALEQGAKLLIVRLGHYTDIADAGTLVGVKATATLTDTTHNIVFKASDIGVWGNSLSVKVAAASNLVAGEMDLTVSLTGYPELTYTVKNIKRALTTLEKDRFNSLSPLVKIDTFAGTTTTTPTLTFTSGAQDVSAIVNADYIGSSVSGTGIRAFDNSTNATKICIPHLAIPAIDAALVTYVESRKDMIALLRTPVGLNSAGILDYRNATGSYSGTAVSSWKAFMFTGGVKISHPDTGLEIQISEISDVMALFTKKDNSDGEWFTAAGPKRGVIGNVLGVVYNLASASLQSEADQIDENGINPVIAHPNFGVVLWGNSTLQKSNTLLKHANIAELMIYLTRELKPLTESELFDPNDIDTWKAVYRRVAPLMDSLVEKRAIWKYLYQGDQNIDDVSQAEINEPSNIDAGAYYFNLFISPKVGMKYLGVRVMLTNSGVDFESLTA